MYRTLRIIWLIIISFLITGCDNNPIVSSPCDESGPIDEGISFVITGSLFPRNNSYKPYMLISLRTNKIYGCLNYEIINSVEIKSKNIGIELLGIELDGSICQTAIGPARAKLFYDVGFNQYQLNINNGCHRDKYTLNVTEDSIEILPQRSTFSESKYDVYWFAPINSFGFYSTLTPGTPYDNDDFIRFLEKYMKLDELTFPAQGLKPYDDRYSCYKYYGVIYRQLELLFSDYAGQINDDYHGDVKITLKTWKGEIFKSWLYD